MLLNQTMTTNFGKPGSKHFYHNDQLQKVFIFQLKNKQLWQVVSLTPDVLGAVTQYCFTTDAGGINQG